MEFRQPFGQPFEVRYEDIELDITDYEQLNSYFLFYKTQSWSPEEEVRLIAHRDSPAIQIFDPQRLTRLILGSKIASANEAQIRVWAADRNPPLTIVGE